MARSRKVAQSPVYPHVVESYNDPRWSIHTAAALEPNAINGRVQIRRYRITIELIDEPVEVLRTRLLELWRTSERNTHTWEPMRSMAAELGIEDPRDFLKIDEQGRDHKSRY